MKHWPKTLPAKSETIHRYYLNQKAIPEVGSSSKVIHFSPIYYNLNMSRFLLQSNYAHQTKKMPERSKMDLQNNMMHYKLYYFFVLIILIQFDKTGGAYPQKRQNFKLLLKIFKLSRKAQ